MTCRSVIDVQVDRPYQVRVGRNLLNEVVSYTDNRTRLAICFPPSLAAEATTLASRSAAEETLLVPLPDGEAAKTPAVLVECWTLLAEAGFTRSDLIIGLGGGAATDVAGFVAASWLRGIDYFPVPTTLLAMVDAAVGGKTGINLPAGKNLVGAFHHPVAVSCDLSMLATLPIEDLRAGMGEVIKCGFIADPQILDLLEEHPAAALDWQSDVLAELVTRAIAVKARVVSSDPFEVTSQGEVVGRELLNYGHTLGHAIERSERYRWRHGEAISVGMAWMAEVSRRLGMLDDETAARHGRLFRLMGLPTSYPAERYDELRHAMSIDKKARGRSLRLIALTGLAQAHVLQNPPDEVLREAFVSLGE
jgi:3-dehydroquinate synthase